MSDGYVDILDGLSDGLQEVLDMCTDHESAAVQIIQAAVTALASLITAPAVPAAPADAADTANLDKLNAICGGLVRAFDSDFGDDDAVGEVVCLEINSALLPVISWLTRQLCEGFAKLRNLEEERRASTASGSETAAAAAAAAQGAPPPPPPPAAPPPPPQRLPVVPTERRPTSTTARQTPGLSLDASASALARAERAAAKLALQASKEPIPGAPMLSMAAFSNLKFTEADLKKWRAYAGLDAVRPGAAGAAAGDASGSSAGPAGGIAEQVAALIPRFGAPLVGIDQILELDLPKVRRSRARHAAPKEKVWGSEEEEEDMLHCSRTRPAASTAEASTRQLYKRKGKGDQYRLRRMEEGSDEEEEGTRPARPLESDRRRQKAQRVPLEPLESFASLPLFFEYLLKPLSGFDGRSAMDLGLLSPLSTASRFSTQGTSYIADFADISRRRLYAIWANLESAPEGRGEVVIRGPPSQEEILAAAAMLQERLERDGKLVTRLGLVERIGDVCVKEDKKRKHEDLVVEDGGEGEEQVEEDQVEGEQVPPEVEEGVRRSRHQPKAAGWKQRA